MEPGDTARLPTPILIFLDHTIAATCLRGIQTVNDKEFVCSEGNFDGGNFYMAKLEIKVEMT
ncbi:115_t:CDS:1, partial [Acaulospora colombiana]